LSGTTRSATRVISPHCLDSDRRRIADTTGRKREAVFACGDVDLQSDAAGPVALNQKRTQSWCQYVTLHLPQELTLDVAYGSNRIVTGMSNIGEGLGFTVDVDVPVEIAVFTLFQLGSVVGSVAWPTIMLKVMVDPVSPVLTPAIQTPLFVLGEQGRGSL
jgi:hypothetical protein